MQKTKEDKIVIFVFKESPAHFVMAFEDMAIDS